ncbi:MAG TPA: UDP-N-acetylglucosamine 2-epimerase (non-hydrolyzing) [Candidatus Methylomirabilis sp.]|nr:UDP-N-acetylglucosamine 2-epimerase (non-hydrolyzing) [Candidatus Methylomirabilis sp.]
MRIESGSDGRHPIGRGTLKIVSVVGGRPNFVKIAPLLEAMARVPTIWSRLVHTGQHYDYAMSQAFFEDLAIPEPDFFLGVGSGTHAEQTAKVMLAFEKVLEGEQPDLVLVVGDVNSTLACALVAAKCGAPVAHVEAGLRSFDRSMPEEINRMLTDHLSEYLFTHSDDGNRNLRREGIPEEKIHFVGNVMIDTLRKYEPVARLKKTAGSLGLSPGRYAVLTLHRPSNVDDAGTFAVILDALEDILPTLSIVFPIHPRSRKRLVEFGFKDRIQRLTNLRLCDPMGYLAFLSLMLDSRLVLTDSGGIQEETTALGIPCLTLRENTERPVTVRLGTNIVVGTQRDRVVAEALRLPEAGVGNRGMPPLWDGQAAPRIVDILLGHTVAGRTGR